MDRNSITYQTYVKILERELVCAMGCTEPIALAYCAAKGRAVLGKLPDRIRIESTACLKLLPDASFPEMWYILSGCLEKCNLTWEK